MAGYGSLSRASTLGTERDAYDVQPSAAGTAIVFYDHLTTLDQEIELIWRRKWSFTSFLFFIVRLFPLCVLTLFNLSVQTRYVGEACFVHAGGVSKCVPSPNMAKPNRYSSHELSVPLLNAIRMQPAHTTCLTLVIIVKRVVCMYGGDKRVLCVLIVGLFIIATYSLVLTILTSNLKSVVSRIQFTYTFETCIPLLEGSAPPWFWTFIYFIFAFEALVFGLSLFQGIKFVREKRWQSRRAGERASASGSSGMLRQILRKTRRDIAGVLLRDSILFPFINLIIATLNIMAWTTNILPYSATQSVRLLAAVSIPTLGGRLLLNLRDAYYKPFHEEYKLSQYSVSDSRLGV
ncbi:hypothetical protein BKA70DRAFT_1565366 [Coprinopsis sp. MPI-PUGE-AT-0042]|nr:hypothetical protein BKA70DRAFT_1565366 [Coprinopsis sp. MPI-PUGE-AT-0042]